MLTERPLDANVKQMLLDNEPFVYAHLIKFERPSRPLANGKSSTSKERYTYLTDASRDVDFNDGTTNLIGYPNGSQNYRANKVLKLSGVTEQTTINASTYTISLDGTAIGAYCEGSVVITNINSSTFDIAWPSNVDLLGAGFREGDKVKLSNLGSYNIDSFRANNTLRYTRVDDDVPGNASVNLQMSLTSEEIKSILLDKNLPEYASFINREVYIYRAYFQDGILVGAPNLIFKGLISAVSFDDDENGITVQWGLTSHWGDFSHVKGRITSDDFHRALNQNGNPQPESALRLAYAYDKGFSHAETSINLLSTYSVQVEKQDIKSKKGFLGIGSKVKVKKYFVSEDQNTNLDFQLQAKNIPVIYGVRNTSGIPVFADTQKDKSSIVYVIQALSEGEIGGLYDVYIGGNSLICNNKADFDARSVQTPDNTVALICRGRSDRGDVLGGSNSVSNVPVPYYDASNYYIQGLNYNLSEFTNFSEYVEPVSTIADNTGSGVYHGQSIKLTSPQEISIDVFSGLPGQRAASSLVEIAKSKNFKIQNDYWLGTDTAEYWGPNHRLLDTAYVVIKVLIAEGETTIPDFEFVVKGKAVQCYNYDYSYSHNPKISGESSNNFNIGQIVSLYRTNGATLVENVQIIDKWTFVNPDGTPNTRFRFSTPPTLGIVNGIPTLKSFYMRDNGSGATWNMITYDYVELSGNIPSLISSNVTSASSTSENTVRINYAPKAEMAVGGLLEDGPSVRLYSSTFDKLDSNYYSDALIGGDSTDSYISSVYPTTTLSDINQSISNGVVAVSANTVKLPNNASGDNDYYKNYNVQIIRYDATEDREVTQSATIVGYDGSSKIATIDDIWLTGLEPAPGDEVVISPKYADTRVSINPVMQLMDYVSSKTYGRGLDPFKDLNNASWLDAGRKCDVQSNVTIEAIHAVNDIDSSSMYRWPHDGDLIWQGRIVGYDNQFIEFTEVIGKLTNKWNNWKSYKYRELVYSGNNVYQVNAPGVKTTEPTHTSGEVNGLVYLNNVALTKIAGPGPEYLTMKTNGNPVRAQDSSGNIIPGYSLYDCDGVDYWRLLGWDEFNQRYVTRHQTNLIVDTSLPLFDNVNSFLEHFGGIMRYSSGQYYLDVEDYEGIISDFSSEVRNITADHIIGKIRLSDDGIKGSVNSVTAAYADPANKFESRNISFFNSEYLKADRNVPKKGNVSIPGITNYYNTRILADKYLNKTRFGLTISFNMAPRGMLLLAGTVIQVQYPRYSWVDKKFRISSVTHQEDTTVDIVAEEYDDSFYVLSKISKQAGSGLAGSTDITSISPPTQLIASNNDANDELYSGVNISWVNNPAVNSSRNVYTELYSSYSNQLYVTVATISGNVLSTTTIHNLRAGELITSQNSVNGLESGKSYYIRDIISDNQFTISENKGGELKGLSDGTNIGASMLTGNLIATLPVPSNSFVDVFGGVDGRVVKYYWVRHKVIQGI